MIITCYRQGCDAPVTHELKGPLCLLKMCEPCAKSYGVPYWPIVTTPVAYFIHRVQKPNRRLNLDRSYRWIRWLVDTLPDVAICATWLPYCEALDEENYRARGLRDGQTLAGLGGIGVGIVCGPQISDGCKGDIENLARKGIASVTLTDLGFEEPPPDAWQGLRDTVRSTVMRAIATRGPVLWSVDFTFVKTFQAGFCDVFPEVEF